jgi:hypothetical protein
MGRYRTLPQVDLLESFLDKPFGSFDTRIFAMSEASSLVGLLGNCPGLYSHL